jgi:hypothetical protein
MITDNLCTSRIQYWYQVEFTVSGDNSSSSSFPLSYIALGWRGVILIPYQIIQAIPFACKHVGAGSDKLNKNYHYYWRSIIVGQHGIIV